MPITADEGAYPRRPDAPSAPDRMAAIATLFGLTPADPATAHVLDAACGDGANLLPWAVRYPRARFVGCERSATLLARAREAAAELGLANVELIEGDVRHAALPEGAFDCVVAHGIGSTMAPAERDALFALAHQRLAPQGVVLTSYRVLPGGYLHRIGADAVRLETSGVASERERRDGAVRVRDDLASAWRTAGGMAAALAVGLAEDDEADATARAADPGEQAGEAVYFTTFVRQASRHGLGFLAEAALGTMGAAGLPPAFQRLIASSDPIAREQYLDFARVRAIRRSLLVRAEALRHARLSPQAIDALHATAPAGIEDGSARDALVARTLTEHRPGSVPVPELRSVLEANGVRSEEARARVVRAAFGGELVLHATPVTAAARAGARPRAFAFARWQAARGGALINLLHEPVRIDEPEARALLARLDGTRDRSALAASLEPHPDARAFVERALDECARKGLLEA